MTIPRKVLHVAPHLGGGVGRFVTNVYSRDEEFDHLFLLLEAPENEDFLNSSNIKWMLSNKRDGLSSRSEEYDAIQIEFWNHPLLYRFLLENNLLKRTRVLFYSHVNGLYEPGIITETLVRSCDNFMVSTFASTHSKAISSADHKISVVPEFGGCGRTSGIRKVEHEGFNVVYIGSADRIKLHPAYISMCRKITERIPQARFIFCSQDDHSYLRAQAEDEGILTRFTFHRNLRNIDEVLEIADVFGYPLNPRHFGTGEQALIESMGASVPPVVLDNLPERYIVDDGITGIIAGSVDDYVEAVEFLYSNPGAAKDMGQSAREKAMTEMSEVKTLSRLHEVYKKVLAREKTDHVFFPEDTIERIGDDIGLGLFAVSQGAAGEKFLQALDENGNARYWKWKIGLCDEHLSPHKGTLAQYQAYFPGSKGLARLVDIVSSELEGDKDLRRQGFGLRKMTQGNIL